MSPYARAGRHAVRLRHAQLLADELRGAPGWRFCVPLSPLGARAGERSRRAGAARLGRVRPAVRQRPYTSAGVGPLPRPEAALVVADPRLAPVGAEPADDGAG